MCFSASNRYCLGVDSCVSCVVKLKEENSKLNGYVHAQSARLEHFEQERTMMQGLLNRLSSDITSEAKQKAEASVSSSS